MELVCSARSAEVHAATRSGRAEYVCTLKGEPRGDGLWAFSCAGSAMWRAVTLRLLSLAAPGRLELRSVLPARRGAGVPPPASQTEKVRAQLESLAAAADGSQPRAALIASIARSALDQSARGGAAGGGGAAEAPELSLRRLAAEVAAQGAEVAAQGAALARVEAAVAALRATADETAALVHRLAAAQSGA